MPSCVHSFGEEYLQKAFLSRTESPHLENLFSTTGQVLELLHCCESSNHFTHFLNEETDRDSNC